MKNMKTMNITDRQLPAKGTLVAFRMASALSRIAAFSLGVSSLGAGCMGGGEATTGTEGDPAGLGIPLVAAAGASPCEPGALVALSTADNNLYRWATQDAAAYQLAAATRAGTGLGDLRLLASDQAGGALFAVTSGGTLRRYVFDGVSYVSPTDISQGWNNITQLVPAGGGVLFARDTSGNLRWYRWLNDSLGQGWAAGSGTKVSTGWNAYAKIFSGGNGILYAVRASDGALVWYRNTNPLEPQATWLGPKTVGNNWGQYGQIAGVGGGYLFATSGGTLREFRHLGYATGTNSWESTTGVVINQGWSPYTRLTAGPTACGLLDSPVELRAYPGGDGIGLRWNPAAGTHPTDYTVYRDGAVIAHVTPPVGAYVDTARYVDRPSRGVSHSYAVAATVGSLGTSAKSPTVSATLPNTSAIGVPVVDVLNSEPGIDAQINFVTQTIRDWYPKIGEQLIGGAYTPFSKITVVVWKDLGYPGVADGNTIWFDLEGVRGALTNPNYAGTLLHEATHILQQYKNVPSYIGEGMAVWATHNIFNDANTPFPTASYLNNAYNSPAYLFRTASTLYGKPNLPRDLNALANAGNYTDDFFIQQTNHSISDIWSTATNPIATP